MPDHPRGLPARSAPGSRFHPEVNQGHPFDPVVCRNALDEPCDAIDCVLDHKIADPRACRLGDRPGCLLGGAVESATELVTILASPELLAQITGDWSPQVRLRVHHRGGGLWDMEVRESHTND